MSTVCLSMIVKNETKILHECLDSIHPHIDYWVIQDNGSKDGTQDIIRETMAKAGVPGQLYETEWTGIPGKNRDHALQKCIETKHGCDWILRVDADETLCVEQGFDWSVLEDLTTQSFNILAKQGTCNYYRTWLWNAKLPWRFKHDKRHECIYLETCGEDFQRKPLDDRFHHIVFGDGNTWENPYKYLIDALELERDLLLKDELHTDRYHLNYTAKSYRDYATYWSSKFPLGEDQRFEAARRGIYLFRKLLELHFRYPESLSGAVWDENCYVALVFLGELYEVVGDHENACKAFREAEPYCPPRNEHLMKLAKLQQKMGDNHGFLETTTRMMEAERVNPFPRFSLFLENTCYHNTGSLVSELHSTAICMAKV